MGPVLSKSPPMLWYENEAGVRDVPSSFEDQTTPRIGDGFVYQFSRFPRYLHENVCRIITKEDLDSCRHEETLVDHGLIPGLEGRRCRRCGGRQTKAIGSRWPEAWDGEGSSRPFMSGSSSYPHELVLAMTRPSLVERLRQIVRGGWQRARSFDDAVLFAAISCEGCLNVLLWEHGCGDGYPRGSKEHSISRTSCELCEPRKA